MPKDASVKDAPATDPPTTDVPSQDGPPGGERAKAVAGLAEGQKKTQADTKKLADSEAKSGAKLKHLDSAHDEMGQASKSLDEKLATAAVPHQQSALDALRRQLEETNNDLVAKEAQLSAEKFAALQKDQVDQPRED